MINRIEETNYKLKSIIEKEDTIIIDWSDLNQAFHQFKINFSDKLFDDIIESNKKTLSLKMHQHLGVKKTMRLKNEDKKKILWGHIQRSGKSYIIGGCIIEDSRNKTKCNYLIITTAPNETIEQQIKVFDCIQLSDFNIVALDGDNKQPKLSNKNIILCSKQFLQTKIENNKNKVVEKPQSIPWLRKMSFEMRFIDESHNGGTTELAVKTLEYYGDNSFTVQITATYIKPLNEYNIPKDCCILWDLEDIKLCRNILQEGSITRLVEKHGNEINESINIYSLENIVNEYSKYPELWLLTDKISEETIKKIINRNNYKGHEHDGYSLEGVFLLTEQKYIKTDKIKIKKKIEPTFQNPARVLDLFYRIFGKIITDEFGDIYDEEYPRNNIFIERIKNICENPEYTSRFIGQGDFKYEPMIIMGFLPQNNIDKISQALITLLRENNVIPDYEILKINSDTTSNPKQSIENARNKARIDGKKGVLVLSGKQCSLGVSINNCDIVLLLNNNTSFDLIYQMMFRCMTEGKNKKCGFVIDMNIHRAIDTSIINYASIIKPCSHPREATKFILQERLINLNGDHWMTSFGNEISKIDTLCRNVYDLYSSNTEKALNHFLNRLRFKEILLTKEEQIIFNAMFSNKTPTKNQKELMEKFIEDNKEDKIQKGIEKTIVNLEDNSDSDSDENDENEDEEENTKMNYMDILKHVIPLICLLTIHNEDTSFIEMFNFIESDNYIYNILIEQTRSWWGKSIDSQIIKTFITMYRKYIQNDKETNQIIRTVKELFVKNIKNNRELSNLIDKYLIPQELEKKSNAEVTTPFKLRQEMLDKIPLEFWKSIKYVFEPCSGKGGFIIDIIDRFMEGLEDIIPDKDERYKTIVENCIYFSDINPTNIYICKLLVDPYNEYKLNYNLGNTLELDIQETKDNWKGVDGFHAVIGNPPYESENASGDNKLYLLFTDKALKNWIKPNNYLLFITPPNVLEYFINNKNRKYIENLYKFKYIAINTPKKYFNVGSKFCYYLIENEILTKVNVDVEYLYDSNVYEDNITITRNTTLFPYNYINQFSISICEKLLAFETKFDLRKMTKLNTDTAFRIRKKNFENKTVSLEKTDEYKYKIIDKLNKTNPNGLTYYIKTEMTDYENKKIIFSKVGYLTPIIVSNCSISDNLIYLNINDKIEYDSLISIINSKLFKFLIKTTLFSGMDEWKILMIFPKLELNKIWNDKLIYKFLNLTKDEINIIENY